jgi:hypothetical protein
MCQRFYGFHLCARIVFQDFVAQKRNPWTVFVYTKNLSFLHLLRCFLLGFSPISFETGFKKCKIFARLFYAHRKVLNSLGFKKHCFFFYIVSGYYIHKKKSTIKCFLFFKPSKPPKPLFINTNVISLISLICMQKMLQLAEKKHTSTTFNGGF